MLTRESFTSRLLQLVPSERLRCAVLIALISVPFRHGMAQALDSTILLKEVRVIAHNERIRPNSNARNTELGPLLIESNLTQSLSELLSDNTVLYIKQSAQGGLATSSFRGTSSGQTQVAWNGIIINSPTVGSFDFSQIPAFFTDRIAIHHGMNATTYSTGALGGSILLGNRSCLNEPLSVRVLSEYGSNNTFSEGITVGQGNSTLGWRTRFYYQQSDNNYRYLNKDLAHEAFYERRANAEYLNYGAMQELTWKPSDAFQLESNLWFMGSTRSLPQPTTVVVNKHESQQTNNLKWLTSATATVGAYELRSSIGVLYDVLDYQMRWLNGTGTKKETNHTSSLIASAEVSRTYNTYTGAITMSHRYDHVRSDNYGSYPAQQHASTLRISNNWRWNSVRLNTDIAVEQNNKIVIPTITTGIDATLIPDILTLKGCAGYNHRFPSLNDRYWQPGGNSELRPEQGFSADGGVVYRQSKGKHHWHAEATYYEMHIDNWIAWLPNGKSYYWTPQNIRKVRSNGVELTTSYSLTIGSSHHKISSTYAYAHSVSKTKGNLDSRTFDKQLPYIPRHKANARLRSVWKGWMLSYGMAFTDKRFTTADESYSTTAYTLHDMELSYTRQLWHCKEATIRLRVENLFDRYYESTQYYPMPLRSFNTSVSLRF